ncbi:S9 family peptidase [Streptomyces sp. A012304]|uniref:alpha/beta hydrolase family protein n=1 Tax=Streptomyces sp. A012304 TaxID=375446 RepID=UPI00223172D0|nr:S9 family peptidase [Streptomyces sp. A012304]GKQ41504.1 alpha/beta hydrolase [Streptomyces sp. A012304]
MTTPTRARTRVRTVVLAALALLAAPVTPAGAAAATDDSHIEGLLPSGAAYVMDVPSGWNGTVLLFSHGYTPAGAPNPAHNAPNAAARELLLKEGYALIGSSYATTGWAVTDAVPDQLATLDAFTARFGEARRTIAWGSSYGGLVTTAIAERHPGRIDGSLPMCGLVHGGVANWNSTLDAVFALKALLAPDSRIALTGFPDGATAARSATALTDVVSTAQQTDRGRARIALAAALHDIPVWNDPAQPRPAATDWDTQQANQYQAVAGLLGRPAFVWRQEAESRAGGSMSWNTGVDYTAMLRRSTTYKEVTALYKKAGLSLRDDLTALNRTPRLAADPAAVDWMSRTSAFTGELRKPELSIHTTGDALVPVQVQSAYRRAAGAAGSAPLLRQAYVDTPGHCTFAPGEQLAALHTLEDRIATGHWGDTGPRVLNARARAADPAGQARYVRHSPAPYPRPYDLAHPADRP